MAGAFQPNAFQVDAFQVDQGPQTYTGTVAETATASDALASTLVGLNTAAETATPSVTPAGSTAGIASQAETITASEGLTAGIRFPTSTFMPVTSST